MVTGKIMEESPIPKKDLGQHWLTDKDTLKSIVDLAEISEDEVVLEIGPGLGDLTEILLDSTNNVIAVEFDESLIEGLRQKFKNTTLQIENEDIRKFNLTRLPKGYKVVANIPYYLTSYLIRLLSQSSNPPDVAVLLIQQEVAERLAAKPGQLSVIGIMAQIYWDIEIGPIVPPTMFTPPPKVNSQVIRLTRKAKTDIPNLFERDFFRLVKIGFSQRRKTLNNNLSAGLHISKDEARKLTDSVGLKPGVRAQELTIVDWKNLDRVVSSRHNK